MRFPARSPAAPRPALDRHRGRAPRAGRPDSVAADTLGGPLPLPVGRPPGRAGLQSVSPRSRRPVARAVPRSAPGANQSPERADDLPARGGAPLRSGRPDRAQPARLQARDAPTGGGALDRASLPAAPPRPGRRAASSPRLEPARRDRELRERSSRPHGGGVSHARPRDVGGEARRLRGRRARGRHRDEVYAASPRALSGPKARGAPPRRRRGGIGALLPSVRGSRGLALEGARDLRGALGIQWVALPAPSRRGRDREDLAAHPRRRARRGRALDLPPRALGDRRGGRPLHRLPPREPDGTPGFSRSAASLRSRTCRYRHITPPAPGPSPGGSAGPNTVGSPRPPWSRRGSAGAARLRRAGRRGRARPGPRRGTRRDRARRTEAARRAWPAPGRPSPRRSRRRAQAPEAPRC